MPAHQHLIGLVRALFVLLSLISASMASAAPQNVRVGAFITSISGIDFLDGSYRIVADLRFISSAENFDPMRDIKVLARQSTLTKMEQIQLEDGETYFSLALDAIVDQAYDVEDFPFGSQTLSLAIESRLDASRLVLVADDTGTRISDVVNMPDWGIEDVRLEATRDSYEAGFGHVPVPSEVSRLNVAIDIEPHRSFLIFEKFTGFLVAMVITTLVFAVPVSELGSRIGMTTSSVFAAVFNRYRLGDSVGFQSTYGLMDQISLITFGAILTALMISLLSFNLASARSPTEIKSLDRLFGAGAMLFYWCMFIIAFAMSLGR